MDKKINVDEIMSELEDKIKNGLEKKQLDVTGISQLIGEHLGRTKEKIMKDVSSIVEEKTPPSEDEKCKECGGTLKKTKKRTN